MADQPADADLGSQVAGLLARHMASYVAGLLLAAGAIQPDQKGQAIGVFSSIILAGIAAGWSFWRKWRRAKGQAQASAQVVSAAQASAQRVAADNRVVLADAGASADSVRPDVQVKDPFQRD